MKSMPVIVLSVIALGCGPAPTTRVLPVLATATSGDLTLELLGAEPLHVGQNYVSYRVTSAGVTAPHAMLTQHPLMDMGTLQHACPLQDPDHEPNADGLFPGLLVFTMASMADATWSLDVEVALEHEDVPVKLSLGALTVGDSTLKQVMTRDGRRVTLTLGFSEGAPHVGKNPLVVTAHVAHDAMMMAFDPVTDLAFTLTPEMPAMGHGSSNNQAPTLGEDGLYRGTVNFSMAGDWVVHLGASAGDGSVGAFDFPFSL